MKNLVLAWCCLLATVAEAQQWSRFRGANGAGNSAATTVPVQWNDEQYNWQVDLPGNGHSSPVLWGNLLVVTCGREADGARIVLGLDADTGQQRWRAEFDAVTHRKHQLNSFASATPALDAERVYLCWGTPDAFLVTALDHQGRQQWQQDLGPFRAGHGDGVSPIVFEDLVLIAKEHEGESEVVGLDSGSGKVRWRVARDSRSTWATPCLFRPNSPSAELILVNYEHGITSLNPRTGELHWEADVFDRGHFKSTISSPVVTDELILGVSGYLGERHEAIAVRPERQGATRTAAEVYRLDRGVPLCTTLLVSGDWLFLWSDEGIVTCADVRTGNVRWRKRVGGAYYASPIRVGEHIYNVSADGTVVVLAAGPRYELRARNELGEGSHSTPAVADGVMYLRTFSKLFSLGGGS